MKISSHLSIYLHTLLSTSPQDPAAFIHVALCGVYAGIFWGTYVDTKSQAGFFGRGIGISHLFP